MKETLLLKVDSENPDRAKIQIAAQIIQKGGLVAFPTETVYGLGADALNSDAVLALFEAKKRPLDNPPIVHVADASEVYRLVQEVPEKAELLMKKFWPGPLTLGFQALKHSSQRDSCRFRHGCDSDAKTQSSPGINQAKRSSIAAPSANLAGKPSPTTAKHVYEDLNGRIDVILDGGATRHRC